MYFNLINAMKRRLILELRGSFAEHPVYEKLVPNIQNKFSFAERPQQAIVIKGSSANKVQLSADNHMGIVDSHVMLANVGRQTYPIEWVRDDNACIDSNGGIMPTPPGVYYLEILSVPEDAQSEGAFVLDPLLTISDELVLKMETGIEHEAQLQQPPIKGTLRLWENRRFLLQEGSHYTIDYTSGAITLLDRANPGSIVTADYRYEIPSVGPFPFQWNTADFKTLPGVVMAFGKRARVGDKVAVVVYEDMVPTATATGGKFELSFDLDIIARDSIQVEEIADLVVMYLWAIKRSALASEGIEITDLSIGGEAEEAEDETGDENYYTASIAVQLQSDWEVHTPLPLTLSRATATTPAGDREAGPLDTVQASTIVGDANGRLFYQTAPIIAGRNHSFERIK